MVPESDNMVVGRGTTVTHLEQYRAFLDTTGVDYVVYEGLADCIQIHIGDNMAGEGKVVWDGYMGFGFSFTFDRAGKLISVGAWE